MKHSVIVEDNLITLRALQERLDWNAFGIDHVEAFSESTVALEHCRQSKPDLVIADIVMPGITGLELADEIKKLNEDTVIIIVSAHDQFEYARRALNSGIYDYILKPIDYGKLADVILTAMEYGDARSRMKRELIKAKPLLLERFAKNLVEGSLRIGRIKDEADFLGIVIPDSPGVVSTLEIKASTSQDPLRPVEDYHLFIMDLYRHLKERNKDRFSLSFQSLSYQTTLISWIDDEPKAYESFLNDLRNVIPLHRPDSWTVTIGVGSPADMVEDLHTSWEESKLALEYQFFTGTGVLIPYKSVAQQRASQLRSITDNSKLLEALATGEKQIFCTEIRRIFDGIEHGLGDRERVFIFFAVLIGQIGLIAPNELRDWSLRTMQKLTGRLKKQKTIDAFLSEIGAAFDEVVALVWPPRGEPEGQTIRHIHDFIGRHLSAPGLGVQEIAGEVGYTPNYLSAYYKEKTGGNLLHYIQTKRINRAKALLLNSEMTMAEIAEDSGFSNQYYFSVLFKRFTGATPREYRKNNRAC